MFYLKIHVKKGKNAFSISNFIHKMPKHKQKFSNSQISCKERVENNISKKHAQKGRNAKKGLGVYLFFNLKI